MAIGIPDSGCKGLKLKEPQCQLCLRVCKRKALTFDKELQVDAEKCNECGLCHGICPNLNFALTGRNQQAVAQVEARLKEGQSAITIGCQPFGAFACLGSIAQENLYKWLGMGLEELQVKHGDCAQCGRHGAALLELRLDKLQEVARLSKRRFSYNLHKVEAAEEQPETDRRQFFRQMARTTAGAVLTLTDKSDQEAEQQEKQSILAMREGLQEDKIPFGYGLRTTEACAPCRICSAFCPHGALRYEQVEGEQQLHFNPHLCTGCGFCVAACPKQALELVDAPQRETQVLAAKVGIEKPRAYWE